MANTAKQTIVTKLETFLSEHKDIALIQFEKTPHVKLEALRRELRTSKNIMHVVKNSLLEKTVNKLSSKIPSYKKLKKEIQPLKFNTGVIGLDTEWSNGLKSLSAFMKKEGNVQYKSGIIESEVYGKDEMVKLSALPGKLELIGKIVMSMKLPAFRIARSIKFPSQRLVTVLTAQSKKVQS